MDEVEIHANGLLLRPWLPADATEVLRACQDPQIQRWTTLPSPYLPEHATGFVTTHTRHAWTNGTAAPFGVFDPASGEMLGADGLISIRRGAGEVGYWVAPWARAGDGDPRPRTPWPPGPCGTLGLTRLAGGPRWATTRPAWSLSGSGSAWRASCERPGIGPRSVRSTLGRPRCCLASCARPTLRSIPCSAGRRTPSVTRQPRLRTLDQAAARRSALRPLGAGRYRRRSWPPRRIRNRCAGPPCPTRTRRPMRWSFVTIHCPGAVGSRRRGRVRHRGADDAYAGSMELRLTGADVAEVGFLVAPWARGRGLATAALTEVCRWGIRRPRAAAHRMAGVRGE